ncbi:MAG: VWA domain-containing protein [Verrucomicrobia bacterium]|nr:VWA domain-containing protein [Verrucomicrobiota bacterium]
MTFAHPQLLWLLLAPLALLFVALRPARAASASPFPRILRGRLNADSLSLVKGRSAPRARAIALVLSLACLLAALARPQGAEIGKAAQTEARDVLVAVDVSRSMLADDVPPTRLDRARLLVRSLADELKGERLGLLPFAGSAFLQSPLSVDYEIFRTFVDELGPDMIPAGGSDFAALLTVADDAFGPVVAPAPGVMPVADRYLVILSDGEAQDPAWKPIARKLAARGVRIITLGLGTAAGAMVPDAKGGLIKDARGAAVLSRLDASTLQELARLSDGVYRDASTWLDLPAILRETIARGRSSRSIENAAPRREELFSWFLAPSLLLLALALVREFPISPAARALRAVRNSPVAPALLALLLVHVVLSPAQAQTTPLAKPAPAEAEAPTPRFDPIVDLVGQLADSPAPAPRELARFARLTVDRGEAQDTGTPEPMPRGALLDALAAVNQGEAADPKAAEWRELRIRLQKLLNPPKNEDQEPPPDEQQQSGEEKKQSGEGQPSPSDQEPKDDQKKDSKESNAPGDDKRAQSDTKPASAAQEALGDLKPEGKDNNPPAPPPKDGKPPKDSTQRVGGVSASGQPDQPAAE